MAAQNGILIRQENCLILSSTRVCNSVPFDYKFLDLQEGQLGPWRTLKYHM